MIGGLQFKTFTTNFP